MHGPTTTPPGMTTDDPPVSSLPGKCVVIIEDEGMIQLQLGRVLGQLGVSVVGAANNGRDGVAMVLRERPDLVIMDIKMPVMDGLTAMEQILAAYPACVVIVSAYAEYRTRALAMGACAFVTKPVTAEKLLPQIERAYNTHLEGQQEHRCDG